MDVLKNYEEGVEKAREVQRLAQTDGYLPSPVNLDISNMIVIKLNPLLCRNYDIPPKKVKITNTGRTVIVSAKWQQERAYLANGPFLSEFIFSHIHFHWGINEMEGSEHRFDGERIELLRRIFGQLSKRYSPIGINSSFIDEMINLMNFLAILTNVFEDDNVGIIHSSSEVAPIIKND